MNELDEIWAKMLANSAADARAAGRHDVADYLALKAFNDQIRERAVRWLFETFLELAGIANRHQAAISIEREDPHRFQLRGAQLAGSRLLFRLGVRCLTLEAGWTRTPADGFMRGGALAAGRITHFGLKHADVELGLRQTEDLPKWFSIDKNDISTELELAHLHKHFDIFLDR